MERKCRGGEPIMKVESHRCICGDKEEGREEPM